MANKFIVNGNVNFSTGFTWDDTNKRLGIGLTNPTVALDVLGSLNVSTNDSGDASLISNRGFIVFRDYTNTITNRFRGISSAFVFQDAGYNNKASISINNGFTYFNNGGGNVGINTNTDSGQNLQVIGSARIGSTAASAMYWDDTNNRLGIGTSSPATSLHVNGSITAGSFIFGSLNSISTGTGTGTSSIGIGRNTLQSATIGDGNTVVGYVSANNLTTGNFNSIFGNNAGQAITSGSYNVIFGQNAANFMTTGSNNVAIGWRSLYRISTASNNVGIGYGAGQNTGSGLNSTSSNSIYIGYNSKAATDGDTNEIVIGYDVVGLGSNTTVIGNSSTTYGRWFGKLLLGTSVDNGQQLQVVGDVKFGDSTGFTWDDTNKRLGIGTSSPNSKLHIVGAGSTSATYALTVQNSGSTNLVSVRNDGAVTLHAVNTLSALYFDSVSCQLTRSTSGTNGLTLYGPSDAHHSLTISSFNSNNYTQGALSSLRFNGNFVSTFGSTAFSYMLIDGTINQTGSTSITRGLYINPTLTAAADFRAIETTAGNVLFGGTSGFTWDNTNSRLGIGTSSPTVELDVVGAIKSSGRVTPANIMFGTNSQGSLMFPHSTTAASQVSNGINLTFYNYSTTSLTQGAWAFAGEQITATSGIQQGIRFQKAFAPSSGTASYSAFEFAHTINQLGGSSGITRGLYVNPSLVIAADWRSIEWSNNSGWGLYGSGTAPNYLAGNTLIGTTTNAGYKLDVNGTARVTGAIIGAGALAVGFGSIAFCTNATAGGNQYAVALGYDAQASNAHAIAIGYSSRASANPSVAIGKAATASGTYSTAFSNATASGNNSVAFGSGSISVTESSVAMGISAYAYLTGQTAISGGKMAYNGDSQYSVVTLPLNTGAVNSGGVYSFPGIRPSNGTFASGVAQIWLAQVKILFAVRAKSVGVTEFNLKDVYTAIYHLSVTSDINNGTSIIGTPALVNKFSHSSMSGSSVSFTIVSNNLVTSVTPPTWASGQVEFRGTVSYELTELGVYPATI